MNFIDKIIDMLKELKATQPVPEIPIMELWNNQEYFILEELVPPEIFKVRGERSIEVLSEPALRTLIELRELFNASITVNNWEWGGQFSYRGFRPWVYYQKQTLSQHLFGNAFDFDVKGLTADEARVKIKQWKSEGKLKYLTGIEETINWVHIDCRVSNRLDENGLFLFNP